MSRLTFVLAVVTATACGDSPLEPRPALTEVPADLAAVTFDAEGTLGVPYVMVELHRTAGFRGFLAINGAGEPVWYHRTEGGPLGFAPTGNGNFVMLDTSRGLIEVTPAGTVVRQLAQEDEPGRVIHHDLVVTRHNTVLFIARVWRAWGDTLLAGEAIWEWNPKSGATTRRWDAFEHLDPDIDWGPRSRADDWLHANSLALGARNNVLLSLHFLNQVLSIAPDFSAIEWRLGGTRATIDVTDPFSGQHTVQEAGPNRVLMFDNGFERVDDRFSRAVEYRLQGTAASNVWQWRPARDNWSRIISSVRPMQNGNLLVGFGMPAGVAGSTGPIEVYEVTPDGRVRWHLTVDGPVDAMYRATPLSAF